MRKNTNTTKETQLNNRIIKKPTVSKTLNTMKREKLLKLWKVVFVTLDCQKHLKKKTIELLVAIHHLQINNTRNGKYLQGLDI